MSNLVNHPSWSGPVPVVHLTLDDENAIQKKTDQSKIQLVTGKVQISPSNSMSFDDIWTNDNIQSAFHTVHYWFHSVSITLTASYIWIIGSHFMISRTHALLILWRIKIAWETVSVPRKELALLFISSSCVSSWVVLLECKLSRAPNHWYCHIKQQQLCSCINPVSRHCLFTASNKSQLKSLVA